MLTWGESDMSMDTSISAFVTTKDQNLVEQGEDSDE